VAVQDMDAIGENLGTGDVADERPILAQSALTLLKTDHGTVKELFEQVLSEESSLLPGKRPIIDRILQELELHAKLEETIFYPALKAKTKRDTEDRQQMLEAAEEHATVKDLIRKIKRTTGRDETLRAKVQVLKELVEHHVQEEESEMFAEAERLLGDKRLMQLGAEIEKAKQRSSGRGRGTAAKKKSSARGPAKPAAKRSKA